jgi:hypothetical protein
MLTGTHDVVHMLTGTHDVVHMLIETHDVVHMLIGDTRSSENFKFILKEILSFPVTTQCL